MLQYMREKMMNDIVKCFACAAVGVALGMELKMTDDVMIQAIALAAGTAAVILLSVLFRTDKKETKTDSDLQKPALGEEARIKRSETQETVKSGKRTVRELVLINEEGDVLYTWDIRGKTSLIIGKSTQKEPVDIDLSMSAMGQMISKQHAVLNYTNEGWCIDDIDSKNGTRVRKLSQNAIMDVKLVGSVQVTVGDIIYIASTMLQLR